jgi:hypothetical protein
MSRAVAPFLDSADGGVQFRDWSLDFRRSRAAALIADE